MHETTFLIFELEDGWMWQDIHGDDDIAQLYCVESLEIPHEHLDCVECFDDAMRVSLNRDKRYFRDDWYVNLQRMNRACA